MTVRLMSVSLRLGDAPEIGRPPVLFQTNIEGGSIIGGGTHHQYDISPDGQKFLILSAGDTGESPFNVVINWPAAQKK